MDIHTTVLYRTFFTKEYSIACPAYPGRNLLTHPLHLLGAALLWAGYAGGGPGLAQRGLHLQQQAGQHAPPTLLEKFGRIFLQVTDDAICK